MTTITINGHEHTSACIEYAAELLPCGCEVVFHRTCDLVLAIYLCEAHR